MRRFLWFFGWLVCAPVLGYGVARGNLALVAVAFVLLLLCLYFGLRKLVCPNCGKAIRTVGADVSHCLSCGTALGEPA